MKRLKINHRPRRAAHTDPAWKPLLAALRDSLEWALDLASRLAEPYPEEQNAVERVRAFARATLVGVRAELDIDDVLLTLGIIIAAIDPPARDQRSFSAIAPDGGALPDVHRPTAPPSFGDWPVVHHCPGAHSVLTHRMPHVLYA